MTFFSRALPLTISFTCAAGSPSPQAEKFSLSVHLWVKSKQKSESMMPLTIFLTRVFGVFGVYIKTILSCCAWQPTAETTECPQKTLRCSQLTSVLFKSHRDHFWQLFYPGWLLHTKALQQSVSRLAELTLGTLLYS